MRAPRARHAGSDLTHAQLDPQRFAERIGSWLKASGPESDVVVSCRVRLARNVEGFAFVPRLEASQAEALAERARAALLASRLDGDTIWVSMSEATPVLRMLLRERYLVSRDLAPSAQAQAALPGRAAAFGSSETISVMVNEEDHLRLQSLAGGFHLDQAAERLQALDRSLEGALPPAHSTRLGYLTSCPTNVGTGMRASVMLHLPALSLVRSELEKVFAAAQRTGLAVRGMYGEGSRAAGDLYQVSNQVTLGRSEARLLDELRALVPCIVDFERKVRALLLREQRAALLDRVSRSYGMLRTARAMATDAALAHLSLVRLGTALGLIEGPSTVDMNEIAIHIQKGHVQALSRTAPIDGSLEASERDRLRASYLRRRFATSSN